MSSRFLPADANRLVHSPHYITVEEADEQPVVVMGTENDLLVMLTSLRPSSGTKTYIIMKCCRNLEMHVVLRCSDYCHFIPSQAVTQAASCHLSGKA